MESEKFLKSIEIYGKTYKMYSLERIDQEKLKHLPFSIRVLLESAIRNCDGFHVRPEDVENIVNWASTHKNVVEIPFKPARVILQDFTGVPAVVDFAAMRDAVARLGGDPQSINPICPADLVIDHSVQVDVAGNNNALEHNQTMEFERNKERFRFLKWGAKSFRNMLIVPPGSGIVHQVNLEYLARVVFGADKNDSVLYPDSVVGTDSHTTMINGLGVLGWGVGGIEAEAVMLGQSISMVLPPVVGYRLVGRLGSLATSTDLVLSITNHLRRVGVVGKLVEFFGPGVADLNVADRATIANMCPEYGATCGFFAVDELSLQYLKQTGRDPFTIDVIEAYLRANYMFRSTAPGEVDADVEIIYSEVHELDLATVLPCIAGPKRPHDKVALTDVKADFQTCLFNKVGFKGFGLNKESGAQSVPLIWEGQKYELTHGDIVIAAITSCTNTSNPSVMLGAALVAKKAVELGLTVKPYIKTSLSPGSGVVTSYLESSGLLPYLEKLGFQNVGYGCMTCIGNSGPLADPVAKAIEAGDLVAAAVLSGNRNFEGRVHPLTRANYLASPPLVVAYALAGSLNIDLATEPIGKATDGSDVFLSAIWPSADEIKEIEAANVLPSMFREVYDKVKAGGSMQWNSLDVPDASLYPWDLTSTYIKSPPFFESMTRELPTIENINNARVLLNFGDSVTTDHISPAGAIARTSPAARYLGQRDVAPPDFNSYGSRRGNDAVMARGTFANIRIVNKLLEGRVGPRTIHMPSGQEMDVFDAAERYRQEGVPAVIFAGREYGSGSSRDWAAKGPYLLGVRAVIAESYERIHRSNLIGMGIMPLQFLSDENADSLSLTGHELVTIRLPEQLIPGQTIAVVVDGIEGHAAREFNVVSRFDTEVELTYFRHGGILHYMIRKLLE